MDIDLDIWLRTDGMYVMADAPLIERTPISLHAYPDSRQNSEVCCKLKSITKNVPFNKFDSIGYFVIKFDSPDTTDFSY